MAVSSFPVALPLDAGKQTGEREIKYYENEKYYLFDACSGAGLNLGRLCDGKRKRGETGRFGESEPRGGGKNRFSQSARRFHQGRWHREGKGQGGLVF